MKRLSFLLFILFVSVLPVFSQDSLPVTDTLSIPEQLFRGGQAAWDSYLNRSIDSTIPVKNKAPKGTYTVIVRFILSKDGSVSDVMAETNHGYGMEAEVIKTIKTSPRWAVRTEQNKMARRYFRQSFTFVVPKRKRFLF